MLDLKPGDILPNGATLLLSHDIPATPATYPAKIVLAYEPVGKEFVTWLLVDPTEHTGDTPYCVSGQYRSDYEDALEDYIERTGRPRPIIPRTFTAKAA